MFVLSDLTSFVTVDLNLMDMWTNKWIFFPLHLEKI